MKIEVLLSIMNLKNNNDYQEKLKQNKITGNVVAVNQTRGEIFNIQNGKQRVYSCKERGASKSRNKLMQIAHGEICVFADDDMIYNDNYEKIIKKEYEKYKDADIIIFNIKNKNSKREKTKKIKSKKLKFLNVMRVRTSEITIKKQIIEKCDIKFDENFGPNGIFQKGEETIFMADALRKKLKIYVSKKNIGYVLQYKSSWFTGYNEKFLYDQGAIFYRISPKRYKLLIFQYLIRKYFLYRKNLNLRQAYKQMLAGANECKEIYG